MKRILAVILIISVVLMGLPLNMNVVQGEESEDVTLRIHYHRFDNNYEGWNLWLWPEGGGGVAYNFESSDDYGSYTEVTVPGSASTANVGIIVRLNEWEAKDVESDRFIPMDLQNDEGIIDVYLVQSEATIYYELEDVDLSPKFISAELSGTERADIKVTVPFVLEGANESFELVTSEGREIGIKYMTSTESGDMVGSATLVFEEELSIEETYFLSSDDIKSYPLSMTKAFDMPNFDELFYYDGDDLGASYTKESTSFRLWAPTAREVSLMLYTEGSNGELIEEIPMDEDVKGTYVTSVERDLNGVYYTYKVLVGDVYNEAVDPYAKAIGVNGNRAMVIDMEATNPDNWDQDVKPEFDNATDAIVYELHIRDLSMSETSGITNKGKFLGLTETGTTNDEGLSTGLDHIKDLGITHLQLLPVFDYRSIDETSLENNNFNWGYDPQNYNAVEGSYSSDPTDGAVRINEFKTMVQTLHSEDIRVVMDVVYNHTGASVDSHLNKLVPNYYYRIEDGKLSNGSGCGNETASERAMVRKMIVESVVYWASEYHIDGFRFDLMGLHDLKTMNLVRSELDKIDPSIIIYGEGWTAGATPLKEGESCLKANTFLMPGIGAFSDDLRDAIKGHVFEAEAPGFVNGGSGLEESVKFGVVGATMHSQIDYSAVNYSDIPWADSPAQSINYAEAHDNLTLWDKLQVTNPDDSREDLILMDKMSAAIFLTSQGVPFIHAGMEFLRSKDGDHNSYQSSDEVNMLDWSLKSENIDVYNYYKGLIGLRKNHPAFRMTEAADIAENISFYGSTPSYGSLQLPEGQTNTVAYLINNNANGDDSGAIFVGFNGTREAVELVIPSSNWVQVVDKDQVDLEGIKTFDESSKTVTVNPLESVVLLSESALALTSVEESEDEDAVEAEEVEEDSMTENDNHNEDNTVESMDETNNFIMSAVIGGLVIIIGLVLFFVVKKKN